MIIRDCHGFLRPFLKNMRSVLFHETCSMEQKQPFFSLIETKGLFAVPLYFTAKPCTHGFCNGNARPRLLKKPCFSFCTGTPRSVQSAPALPRTARQFSVSGISALLLLFLVFLIWIYLISQRFICQDCSPISYRTFMPPTGRTWSTWQAPSPNIPSSAVRYDSTASCFTNA